MAAPSRRVCAASAKRPSRNTSRPTSTSPIPNGCLWADPNSSLPCGTFNYPTQLGGPRVFNANGIPQNTVPIIANLTGRNITISMPASLAADFANPNAWTMKTLESGEDYNRDTALTALRFDGHYKFNDAFHLDFGVRNSIRSAE